VVEQTDEGQEMEITPLLTSVENRGAPGRFVGKIFLGFGGRIEAEVKGLYLYMHGKWGSRDMFLEKYFWGAGRYPRLGTPSSRRRLARREAAIAEFSSRIPIA